MNPTHTFARAFASGPNSLDTIRLAAACLVLASHAWVLTGHGDAEPIARLSGNLIDGGGLAVAAFFIISGFLIARSAGRHRPLAFLRARALRIYPAFLIAVAVQTLLLAPALTTLPAMAYLVSPAPWIALVRSLAFSTPATLPGLFTSNPLPGVVNGSLWTLRIEAVCYLVLLGLAVVGLMQPRRVLLPLAFGWALLAAVLVARLGLAPPALASLRVVSIVDCLLHFLMGAAIWAYASRIPHHPGLAVLAAIAIGLAAPTPVGPIALHLALPYLVLYAGLTRPILPAMPDLSYGTYLYAFPLQQTLVATLGPISPLALTAYAIVPTLACAALSYRFIERPALRLKATMWAGS